MSIKLKDQNNNEIFIAGTNSEDFINDKVLRNDKTWSSNKIVEELYPTFQKEGNPIICYPVENYPLNVKATFLPKQAGTGDPSPDNVRPISGRDEVTVTRCGKNLLDYSQITAGYAAYGLTPEKIDNYTIKVSGTASRTGVLSFTVCFSSQTALQGKGFTVFPISISGCEDLQSAYGLRTVGEEAIAIIANLTEGKSYDMRFHLMITADNSTPTAYEPYQGDTYTLTLPETIYGGTVDAVSGVGSKEWRLFVLDGNVGINTVEELTVTARIAIPVINMPAVGEIGYCNIVPWIFEYYNDTEHVYVSNTLVYLYVDKTKLTSIDVAGATSYLAAQYAAGTPVTVCYKLATPEPFQATGNQPIPAVAGLNTLYTDGDNLIISGKENIKYTINQIISNIQNINQIQEINNILLGVE